MKIEMKGFLIIFMFLMIFSNNNGFVAYAQDNITSGEVIKGVNFREEPSVNSSIYKLLPHGTKVEVLEEINRYWLKVQVEGVIGYVSSSYISKSNIETLTNNNSIGTVIKEVNFRAEPSIRSSIYKLLPRGTKVEVLEEINRYWLKVQVEGVIGYVYPPYIDYVKVESSKINDNLEGVLTNSSYNEKNLVVDNVIQTGEKYLGISYLFGGDYDKDGTYKFDCSGFTKYVFEENGYTLPRSSRLQSQVGMEVRKEELMKGDLVFFYLNDPYIVGHVAIYMGNDKIIHAIPSKGVTISNLSSSYWSYHYVGAKRIIE